ncbi:MAG: hypothetical protein ACHREM_09210 [Polyangiales bacterium]
MDKSLTARIWERLLSNASLDGLGLGTVDGRVDFADSSGGGGYGYAFYSPVTDSVVNPYTATRNLTYNDVLTHDGAYLTKTDGTAFEFMDRVTGSETWVRQLGTGLSTVVVEVDRSSGDAPVWTEAAAGTALSSVTLYTGAHATTAAALSPLRVGTIALSETTRAPYSMIANAGYAVQQTSMTSAVVVRLADGMGWTITAEPNEGIGQVLWVDATEAWVATSPLTTPTGVPLSPSDIYLGVTGMMRIRLDSLGAISKVVGP